MEGLHLQAAPLSGEQQKYRRTMGRLVDLMIDRAEQGSDPSFTREVAFERIAAVKDDLLGATALLDREIEMHPEPIVDQWGWDPRNSVPREEA